jgi:putative transcriptional regulator
MSKGGEKILQGLREAVAHASGRGRARLHVVKVPNVKAIRERLEMSQREFATAYRIPLTTLQGWEQGRRRPDAPAAAYLLAIARIPAEVKTAIAG